MDKKLIIGVTGTTSSGKDTVAKYLQEKGFSHYSCSDILREETDKRSEEQNRDNWIKIGNELRQEFGPGILGKKILEKIKEEKVNKTIVSSLRNPVEIKELKKSGIFYLIKVDAPIKLRYQRAKERGNLADEVSFKKFKSQEETELKSDDPTKQQINACLKMADFEIINDGNLKELHRQIENVLNQIANNK